MSEKRKLPDNMIERLIIKSMFQDKQFTATVVSVFEKEYFNEVETE